jgi:hypothetical protein
MLDLHSLNCFAGIDAAGVGFENAIDVRVDKVLSFMGGFSCPWKSSWYL